jgi:hypothetical protein
MWGEPLGRHSKAGFQRTGTVRLDKWSQIERQNGLRIIERRNAESLGRRENAGVRVFGIRLRTRVVSVRRGRSRGTMAKILSATFQTQRRVGLFTAVLGGP